MRGRCGLTNDKRDLFVGAIQYPDRKCPSLVVQRGSQAIVLGHFHDDMSVDLFADAIAEILELKVEGGQLQ